MLAGASSDTGRAIAARLSAGGHTVVALGSSLDRLGAVDAADRIEVDLADPDACTAVAARVLAEHGRVDGVLTSSADGEAGRTTKGGRGSPRARSRRCATPRGRSATRSPAAATAGSR